MPYRTQARWTLLAIRRPSRVWSALLTLGAVCSAIGGVVVWREIPAPLLLAVPSALFASCLGALAWLRRGRIEIFREAIRVHAKGAHEARWGEVVTLHRLFYRNLHDVAHDAGWALDTRDGRRIHIAMTYGEVIERELLGHLAPLGIGVTKTDWETLEAAPRS